MRKADWRREIIKKCKSIGTYKSEFLPVINHLAEIKEQSDAVMKQYKDEGSQVLIEKTSDRGAVNMVKNPLLATWEDLNKDALAYWRDLGLTPAGLKKLNMDVNKNTTSVGLEQILAKLDNGE